MSKTVVGLFDENSSAQAAVQDLHNANIGGNDVMVVTKSTFQDNLMSDLTDAGVPNDDAQVYVAGVRQNETLVKVETTDANGPVAIEIMDRNGAVDIDKERSYYLLGGTAAAGAVAGAGVAAVASAPVVAAAPVVRPTPVSNTVSANEGETVIPIIEEQLQVGKRQVQRGGTRIHTRVTERPVQEQVTLHEEHVEVERHPVNRAVAASDNAFQDKAFEVTETDEVPVVAKSARVVEEVVVGKTASDHVETVTDTIRRTDVEVENIDGATGTTNVPSTRRS